MMSRRSSSFHESDGGDEALMYGAGAARRLEPPGALDWSPAAMRRGRLRCSSARAELCGSALLVCALLAALAATVGHDALSAVVRAQVARLALVDAPDAPQFSSFVDSEDPGAGKLFCDYTFFNLTNAPDVARGARPRYELVGPVSFRYHNEKFDVQFDELRATLQYRQYQRYEPVTPEDARLMELPVVGVDLVLLAALNANQPLGATVPDLFPQSYKDPDALFLTRSAREWLFGYDHPYLPDPQNPLSGRKARFPGVATNDSSAADAAAAHSPHRVATGRGGDAGATMNFVAYDGVTSTTCCRAGMVGEVGAAASGNCQAQFGTWAGDAVRGNIGSQLHPFVDPDEVVQLATYDFNIMRVWPLVCGRQGQGLGPGSLDDASDLTARIGACDSYDVQGVRLNRYTLPSDVLGNESVSAAEAAAFNISGPSGLLNQTACEQYSPVFISRPFFLYASDSVRAALERLPGEADEHRHGSFMGIEPVTGRVLDFAFRMQVNARVRPTSVTDEFGTVYHYFANVSEAYMPLLWGEQHAQVSPAQSEMFTGHLYVGLRLLAAVRWAGVTLAAALLLWAAYMKAVVVAGCRRLDAEEAAAEHNRRLLYEGGGDGEGFDIQ